MIQRRKGGEDFIQAVTNMDSSMLKYRAHETPELLAHQVTAELDIHIADKIADMVIQRLARKTKLPVGTFEEFMEFLAKDPEIMDRFIAYKAAQRITGSYF